MYQKPDEILQSFVVASAGAFPVTEYIPSPVVKTLVMSQAINEASFSVNVWLIKRLNLIYKNTITSSRSYVGRYCSD